MYVEILLILLTVLIVCFRRAISRNLFGLVVVILLMRQFTFDLIFAILLGVLVISWYWQKEKLFEFHWFTGYLLVSAIVALSLYLQKSHLYPLANFSLLLCWNIALGLLSSQIYQFLASKKMTALIDKLSITKLFLNVLVIVFSSFVIIATYLLLFDYTTNQMLQAEYNDLYVSNDKLFIFSGVSSLILGYALAWIFKEKKFSELEKQSCLYFLLLCMGFVIGSMYVVLFVSISLGYVLANRLAVSSS